MLTLSERQRLATLKRALDDAKELVSRFHSGYTNHTIEYVRQNLDTTREAFNDYLDEITEQNMEDQSFTLKASVQTYDLTLDVLAKLFSRELGVPESRITITEKTQLQHNYGVGGDEYVFSGLTVTVKA